MSCFHLKANWNRILLLLFGIQLALEYMKFFINWKNFVSFEIITYYHARTLGENQRHFHDFEMMNSTYQCCQHTAVIMKLEEAAIT